MLNRPVSRGAIFHHSSRRRREVAFDDALRSQVYQTIVDLRALLAQTVLRPPSPMPVVAIALFLEACMPHAWKIFPNLLGVISLLLWWIRCHEQIPQLPFTFADQGSYLRLVHDTLQVEVERKKTFQMPLHHLGGISVFGNVLMSPFLNPSVC